MRAVYRRLAQLGLALLAVTGCSDEPSGPRRELAPPARRNSLPTLLESFEVTPAAACGGVAIRFGTLASAGSTRAVRIEGPHDLPGLPSPSSTLVQLAADLALVQAGDRLWLVGPGDRLRALVAPAAGPHRLLLAGDDGAWLAATTPGGEVLIRADPSGGLRAVAPLPAGLRSRVASRDGARVALVRSDEEGNQLFVHEPAAGSTRLLLPEDHPGYFEPLAFSPDGARLLLVADDQSERPRLEWLDVESGVRSPVATGGCTVRDARLRADGALAIETSCRDRAVLLLTEEGTERNLPTPSGDWAVAAWPDGASAWLYAVASPRHPRDLWRTGGSGEASPVVYGLAARVDPLDLAEPEPLSLATPTGAGVPAALWRTRFAPGERAAGGVIWIERDDSPPRELEFDPVVQFLAQQGLAVLRLRLPAATGDGVPDPAPALLAVATASLRERAALVDAPIALVAFGPRAAAVALAAAERPAPFAAVAALGAAPGTSPPASRGGAPLLLLAAAASDPIDAATPPAEPEVPLVDERLLIGALSPDALGLPTEVATALWRHLAQHLRRPAAQAR